jgi:FkbM family methyltransferase
VIKLRALRARTRAVVQSGRFARWGGDLRSRRLLFYIGILAAIYPTRRVRLFRHLQATIARSAHADVLTLMLRPPAGRHRRAAFPVQLRAGDRADYQSLWECLNDELYPAPRVPIRHVLDGGANLGFFSIALTRLPGVRDVVLVEPDPGNLALLRGNLAFWPAADIHPVALAGHEGEGYFALAASNTGHLRSAPVQGPSGPEVPVRCKRLPDMLPSDWDMRHTWLKLDIEGAEYEVLRDLLATAYRPAAISVEIHDYPSAGGAQLVTDLEKAGYQVQMLDPGDARNVCRQISAVYSE